MVAVTRSTTAPATTPCSRTLKAIDFSTILGGSGDGILHARAATDTLNG